MPAIFAIAYGSLVDSNLPESRSSSLIDPFVNFGYMQLDPKNRIFLIP